MSLPKILFAVLATLVLAASPLFVSAGAPAVTAAQRVVETATVEPALTAEPSNDPVATPSPSPRPSAPPPSPPSPPSPSPSPSTAPSPRPSPSATPSPSACPSPSASAEPKPSDEPKPKPPTKEECATLGEDLLKNWLATLKAAVNAGDWSDDKGVAWKALTDLYLKDALLMPTLKPTTPHNTEELRRDYFRNTFLPEKPKLKQPNGYKVTGTFCSNDGTWVQVLGTYTFIVNGEEKTAVFTFTFVKDEKGGWKIQSHTSTLPDPKTIK